MTTVEKSVCRLQDGDIMLIGSTAKKQRVRVHRARRTTDYGLPAVEVMFSFPEHPDAKMDSIVYGAGQLVTVEKS